MYRFTNVMVPGRVVDVSAGGVRLPGMSAASNVSEAVDETLKPDYATLRLTVEYDDGDVEPDIPIKIVQVRLRPRSDPVAPTSAKLCRHGVPCPAPL